MWRGNFLLGRYVNKICRKHNRNNIIVRLLHQAYSSGHRILLLTDRISHLAVLGHKLAALGVPTEEIGYITAKMKQKDRAVTLATYGSAGIGMDIPDLTCLCMATSRTDIEQAIGRILRIKDAAKTPTVIDITDMASGSMRAWSLKRKLYYANANCEIQTIKINL